MARLVAFLVGMFAISSPPSAGARESKLSFWDTQRRGANFFNNVEIQERWEAARRFGIEVVRLAPNKWLNGRPEARRGDFLLGRPDGSGAWEPKDLALLKHVLDMAEKAGIKVVVTMLSLPASRWKEHNGGVEERAIWKDFARQDEAIAFWRRLASELKDHPAVVGFNIRNEPSPELVKPRFVD